MRAAPVSGLRFPRWVLFGSVGAMGIGVQLAVLALLLEGFGIRYLWATALAVEAAVLHNFFWHERWTWGDRRRGGRELPKRLLRFHAANGLLSLAGNVGLVRLLVEGAGLHPMAANALAIAVCSFLNFVAGDRLVFPLHPARSGKEE